MKKNAFFFDFFSSRYKIFVCFDKTTTFVK